MFEDLWKKKQELLTRDVDNSITCCFQKSKIIKRISELAQV